MALDKDGNEIVDNTDVNDTDVDLDDNGDPSTPVDADVDDNADPDGDAGDPSAPKDSKTVPYDRFKEVNDQKKTAMEMLELETQARIAAEARANAAPPPPAAPVQEVKKPRRNDFDDEDDYQDARDDYRDAQADIKAQERHQAKVVADNQHIAQTEAQRVVSDFNTRLDASVEKIPDIMTSFDFVNTHTPSKEFATALMSSEKSPQMVDYLAKHPAEMAKVKAMKPLEQVKFIGGLEARMEPPIINKKTTNAPPPPTTLGGDHSSAPPPKGEMKQPKGGWTDKTYEAERKRVYGY